MNAGPAIPEEAVERQLPGLRRRRALARAALLFERVWPELWPPLGVLGVFLCAALLGLPAALPPLLHLLLLAATGLAVAWLLARGLRQVQRPAEAEADRRLERDSGLPHRPLAVLRDRPALAGAEPLWAAHLAQTLAQLGRLRVGLPRPGLAARDRHALRGLLAVALAACLGIAGAETPARLLRAVQPAWAKLNPVPATQLQAWITPPAYTGLAPVFLNNEGGAVSVPAGSHLTVNVTGGAGEPALALAGTTRPFQALDGDSFQADAELAAGGRLAVRRDGAEIAGWNLTVVADNAPVVFWPQLPGPARGGGRQPPTRLPWQVSHEYGVASLTAELRLRDRPDAPALVLPIPLPGGSPKSARGARVQDLTAHPWAGLAVIGQLVARDAPGLTGSSAEEGFVLPERLFQHPVARALMEIRKQLTLKPDDRLTPEQEIDRLSTLSEVWDNDAGGFLNLRGVAALLHRGTGAAAVEEAQARLWELAVHLEEGATDRTARALEQARQALREAMDAQQRGENTDPAEIERRMQAVQEALENYLQALAEEARRNPDSQAFDPDAHRRDTADMQHLAEQMRQAAREGHLDAARDKFAELEKMLDELKNMRPDGHGMTGHERQRAERRQRGQQQMNAVQDLVQRLGTLLDHAESRDAGAAAPFGPGLRRP
jgi:uncharacterized protein (TIGR02302 family)